jgi:hypothetical protein
MHTLRRIILLISLTLTCHLTSNPVVPAADYDYDGVETCVTPFDWQYRRVQAYLESIQTSYDQMPWEFRGSHAQRLAVLRECLNRAEGFPYRPDGPDTGDAASGRPAEGAGPHSSPNDWWQLPEETERRGAGDCEDKAIWLYAKLLEEGFEDVRLVVGKYRTDQPGCHAWVVYYHSEKVYILDPTKAGRPWQAKHYPKGFYWPLYSYSKDNRWCHPGGHRRQLHDGEKTNHPFSHGPQPHWPCRSRIRPANVPFRFGPFPKSRNGGASGGSDSSRYHSPQSEKCLSGNSR